MFNGGQSKTDADATKGLQLGKKQSTEPNTKLVIPSVFGAAAKPQQNKPAVSPRTSKIEIPGKFGGGALDVKKDVKRDSKIQIPAAFGAANKSSAPPKKEVFVKE